MCGAQVAKVRKLNSMAQDFVASQLELEGRLDADTKNMILVHVDDMTTCLNKLCKIQKPSTTRTYSKPDSEFTMDLGESPLDSDENTSTYGQASIDTAVAKSGSCQKWPCILCKPHKFFAKHRRHLINKHSQYHEVADILQTDNPKKRRLLFAHLKYGMSHSYSLEHGLDPASSDPSSTVQVYTKKDGTDVKLPRIVCDGCKKGMAARHYSTHIKRYCTATQLRKLETGEKAQDTVCDSERSGK